MPRLAAEHDNLRAALARRVVEDPPAALRLASRLSWYWYLRGHYEEGLGWLEAALGAAGEVQSDDRRRALHGAGHMSFLRCDYDRAAQRLAAARDLAELLGDRRGAAAAEQLLGSIARERGEYELARTRHGRCLEVWRTLGERRELARTQNHLVFVGWISTPGGVPPDDAVALLDEAEAAFRALGDAEGSIWALLNRGAIQHYRGHDVPAARATLARAFAESASARYQEGIAWSLNLIGLASLSRGETTQARAQLRAGLRSQRRLGDLWRCSSLLEALACMAVDAGEQARGAMILGAADALRARIGAPVPACERAFLAVREDKVDDVARARGRGVGLDEAVTLAIEGW
jgi:tetratricopeptide (TPR) repeat protein